MRLLAKLYHANPELVTTLLYIAVGLVVVIIIHGYITDYLEERRYNKYVQRTRGGSKNE